MATTIAPQLRMDLRAAQQMVMTPQLSQAIALLQMNNIELSEYVEEQLAQNPFLEKTDGNPSTDNADIESAHMDSQPNEVREALHERSDAAGDDNEPVAHDGVYEDTGANDLSYDYTSQPSIGSGGRHDFEGDDRDLEDTVEGTKTLRDHLNEQIGMSFADPRDQALAGWLVDFLDASGYLRQDVHELAVNMKVDEERLTRVLDTLRSFDPTGVFAHDLADCLALQLKERGEWDKAYEALLANLDLLAGHELKKLGKICGLDDEELRDYTLNLRTLNPKPASKFDHLIVQTALPDILMKPQPKSMGGGWRVELNNDTLPKVLINQTYVAEIEGSGGKDAKTYVTQQLANANWLMRAMDQRAQTMLAIAAEIVEAQSGFFLYGIEYLRTLTLKDIAEEVGVHESTVSRIVNGKFMATPRGLFELKFFFTSGVTNSEGQDIASDAVKAKIKALIDAEDPKKILSDDTLAELLNKDGINVARRTVAKYREAMGYDSSVLRRRKKNS